MNKEKTWIEMQLLRRLNQDSKYLPQKKIPGQDCFMSEFNQTFNRMWSQSFSVSPKMLKRKEYFQTHSEASIISLKVNKDTAQ